MEKKDEELLRVNFRKVRKDTDLLYAAFAGLTLLLIAFGAYVVLMMQVSG